MLLRDDAELEVSICPLHFFSILFHNAVPAGSAGDVAAAVPRLHRAAAAHLLRVLAQRGVVHVAEARAWFTCRPVNSCSGLLFMNYVYAAKNESTNRLLSALEL